MQFVQEQIPESYSVFLAGWSANPEHVPEDMVGIHHPSADVKKISFANGRAGETCWTTCRGEADHWKINGWTKATTEPGSSGSALFNSQGRVVG